MILEFSVENFRSIKELQTISFVAAPLKKNNTDLLPENMFKVNDDLNLLNSLGVYGANGSGKSNLVLAFRNFLIILRDVMSNENILESMIQPFYFDTTSSKKPSFFQIQFIINRKIYRYGFEANKNGIVSEWLFGPAEKSETYYFKRNKKDGVKINSVYFSEGEGLVKNLSNTNLFLNVVNALNGKIAQSIKLFFKNKILISMGITDEGLRNYSMKMLNSKESKTTLIAFLELADVGIKDLEEDVDLTEENHGNVRNDFIKEDKNTSTLIASRPKYNNKELSTGLTHYFFDNFESQGTKKIFTYAGALLHSLNEGRLFIIDEFDARLHPNLTKKIVTLFNSSEINKKGAQLLFITHDVNLLRNDLLRQDQVYFGEKDTKGRTEFYSLYNIKGIRNDASYEKDYIQGKYGAIPFIGDIEAFFKELHEN